ncbi:NAD(P)H-dependent oxidoreductase [Bifidobacterium sp. UBA744]|uniref:NAD(P)H-dependent oxidoreductase n=1 Tax=Bifidobacterium sp. UBA744 TaxID=1946112 RepID=UPI0025BFAA00|nr:NAD(P)H-dependent oxidoreductase [Bifidobacterium sp. UBA744]
MSTLVLAFHPDFATSSRIGKALADAAESAGVTVVDEYADYPDFDIDVKAEQRRVDAADRVVLLFPFYWYSAPALLKEWEDKVLTPDWAYGNGHALRGKEFQVTVSTGSPAESYTPEGKHHVTMDELLSPYATMVHHTDGVWVKPFIVPDTNNVSDDALAADAKAFVAAITD